VPENWSRATLGEPGHRAGWPYAHRAWRASRHPVRDDNRILALPWSVASTSLSTDKHRSARPRPGSTNQPVTPVTAIPCGYPRHGVSRWQTNSFISNSTRRRFRDVRGDAVDQGTAEFHSVVMQHFAIIVSFHCRYLNTLVAIVPRPAAVTPASMSNFG